MTTSLFAPASISRPSSQIQTDTDQPVRKGRVGQKPSARNEYDNTNAVLDEGNPGGPVVGSNQGGNNELDATAPVRRSARNTTRKSSIVLARTSFKRSNLLYPPPPHLEPELLRTREMLLALKNESTWSSDKTLRELDDKAVAGLESAIKQVGTHDAENNVDVLESMLDVILTFRAFRDSLDGYLEDVEGLGLGLDWGADGDDEDENGEEMAEI